MAGSKHAREASPMLSVPGSEPWRARTTPVRRREPAAPGRRISAWEKDHRAVGRTVRARRVQFTVVVLVTFVMTSGGRVVDLFLAGRGASDGYSTGAVNPSPLGTLVERWAPVPFLVVVVVVLLLNLGRPRANLSGLVGAAIYLVTAQVTNSLAVGGVNPTPKYWVVLALVLALWSIAPTWDDLRILGVLITLIGVASLMTAITGHGWMRQDALLAGDSKAFIGTQLLAGIFPQMNILGMTMALGLPFVLLFRTKVLRWGAVAIVLSNLVLSASRTSLIAVGVVIVVGLVIRSLRTIRSRRTVALGGIALTAAVVVALPLLIHDRDALTSRGAIWMASMDVAPDHLLFGLSTDAFTREGVMPPLIGHTPWHGHNLFVSTIVWGGLLLLAALTIFLISVLVRSMRDFETSMVSYLFVLMLIACSVAEMPLRIDDFDGVSWLTWIAVLSVLMVPGANAGAAEESRRRATPAPRRGPSSRYSRSARTSA